MDNQTISEYNKGWRAYINYDGKMIFQDTRDGFISGSEDIDVDKWQALRAYQDAERKKGVPIVLSHHGEIRWYQRDYGTFKFNADGHNAPFVTVYESTKGLGIVGHFTNFRWRAGYPKGGQHV